MDNRIMMIKNHQGKSNYVQLLTKSFDAYPNLIFSHKEITPLSILGKKKLIKNNSLLKEK